MNQQQVLAAIKQFGKIPEHELPRGFSKSRPSTESHIYKDQAYFIQALTELGNEVRLVFVSNTTSDFRGFVKKLNFQVLTFYRNGDDWIPQGVPTLLIDLLTAGIQIVFSLVLLSFYHPLFVLFGFLLLSLLAIIFCLTGKKGQKTAIKESKFKYKTAFWLQELARNLGVFKLSGSSQMPIERINEGIDGYLIHRKLHFNVLIRQFSYVIAFKTLIIGGLLALGAFLVIDRQITLGQFVAAELIVVQVIG